MLLVSDMEVPPGQECMYVLSLVSVSREKKIMATHNVFLSKAKKRKKRKKEEEISKQGTFKLLYLVNSYYFQLRKL